METAGVDANDEGLVAISPVDNLFWVSNQVAVNEDAFNYFEVDED